MIALGTVIASSSPSATRLPNVTCDPVSRLHSRTHAVTFLSCPGGQGVLLAIGTYHSIAEQRGTLLEKRKVAKHTQQSAILQELIEQHQLVQGDPCPACSCRKFWNFMGGICIIMWARTSSSFS